MGWRMGWRWERYGFWAAAYDLTSLEWPVYGAARRAGVASLGLRPGDRVLDVGCGTGLSFTLLREAVGPAGGVVGVDASDVMLAKARRRVRRLGASNVTVMVGDAADLPSEIDAAGPFDALLAVYALSVIDRWQEAWRRALGLLRPTGRAAVVDLALPRGRWRVLAPAARLACWAGGSDPYRHPWTAVEDDLVDVSHRVLRGGHIHVVTGTRPDRRQR